MKKTLLLWLFGLLLTAQVYAQNRTLSGTVTDAASGEALIGVNVTGKGTTIGTVTDIDGKYTLELPKDVTVLVFTYVGYTNLEKAITSLKIDAAMSLEGQLLEETVITAMAIKREKRSVVSALSTVTSEDFNKGNTNVIGAIQAKVPGLRINTVGGQVGASTRIVLRGETSITGNNNALIVIDGIPVNNAVSREGTSSSNFVDFGNRANDINPDDIESVTVLKGPAAVALYGSRGASGVVLYTTKSGKNLAGKDKKFNVNVNSQVLFDKVYLQFQRQDQFGQGYQGQPDPIENFSWGPAFDGVVRPWTRPVETPNGTSQLIRPYSAVKKQLEDAFDLGITMTNNLSLEGGNDKFTYFLSYGNLRNTGIFPNTFYKRNSITANASAKLSDKISTKFNIQYSNISQRGMQGQSNGGAYEGPYQILIQQPINIPIKELRDFNSPYHDFQGYYGGYTPNPYFILANTNNDNQADNLIGTIELEFKPVEYISLLARVGNNFTLSNNYIRRPQYNYVGSGSQPIGADRYSEFSDKRNQLTIDAIATFNKEIVKNVNLTLLGGYNYNEQRYNTLFATTQGGLVVPGFYHLNNSVAPSITENEVYLYRLIGMYGTMNIGYKNLIFGEYTARNDWSASLPRGNRGFFYQGGGVSFVPTELIKKSSIRDWISYLKVRGNVGTQGKDAPMYRLQSTFTPSPTLAGGNIPTQFPFLGLDGSIVPGYGLGNRIGNPDLKPELTFSWEVGADVTLLKEYLTLEYTYYEQNSKNLIVDVSLPSSSGFTTTAKNIGQVKNKGHELSATVHALRNIKGVNWSFRMAFAKNNNVVVKVSDEADELALSTGSIQVVAVTGSPIGTFKAYDYLRAPDGRVIVNSLGVPSASTEFTYYGNYQAKYTMGFGSTLSWKGLSVDIQFDHRQGGQFYSGTKEAGEWNGTTLSSLVNDRQPYVFPNSVIDNGDGTFTENTRPMTDVFELVGNLSNDVTSRNLLDASYIKLREASISYTLDKKFFKKAPISAITFSVIGRNLKFWLPAENTFADPETNSFGYAGNVQGLEFGSVPTTRSVGFDVKFKF